MGHGPERHDLMSQETHAGAWIGFRQYLIEHDRPARIAGESTFNLRSLLVAGQVVMENPRHVVIADTFNHLAHHRGQLTVYLRLNGVPVPSVYGPSADDRSF